jgi:sugar O-acyltransferase (sialic acid O-acetyltransferase NeuD family)
MDLYGIIGAGGFGREVIPVAREMLSLSHAPGEYEIVFVVEGQGKESLCNGYRVISDKTFFKSSNSKIFFSVAISDNQARKRITDKAVKFGAKPFSIIARNSVILDGNEIGEGAILCPFTTITSNARVGRFFHANIYSYVAHDCSIGDFVTFAPGVHCNGRVVIEDYVYVGTGAIIKDATHKPIVIGKGSVIGMGAVVTKSIPAFTVVAGNPASELSNQRYSGSDSSHE